MTAVAGSPKLLDELWEQGYGQAHAALDDSELTAIAAHLHELATAPPSDSSGRWWEPAVAHAALDTERAPFRDLMQHDLLRSVANHVLGPYAVTDLRLRASFPGAGLQPLDAARTPNHTRAVRWEALVAVWSISPGDPAAGELRVVPGSHRTDLTVIPDDFGAHPDEVLLETPPGSVVFLHPRLLHGETLNRSSEVRVHVVAELGRVAR